MAGYAIANNVHLIPHATEIKEFVFLKGLVIALKGICYKPRGLMLITTIIVLITSIWVYFDSKSIWRNEVVKSSEDLSPRGWFLLCLFFWIICFPFYIIKRITLKKIAPEINSLTPIAIGLLALGTFIFIIIKPALNSQFNQIVKSDKQFIETVNHKVTKDFIAQYEIVKRNGSKIDACVRAGIVAESFLQANDEVNYRKWKNIQNDDCQQAGLPEGFLK